MNKDAPSICDACRLSQTSVFFEQMKRCYCQLAAREKGVEYVEDPEWCPLKGSL